MNDAETIERIKNEKRWLEKSFIIIAFHNSKCKEHDNTRGNKWKVSDTSNALGLSIGYVSESIKLAKMSSKYDFSEMTREKALDMVKSND
jgi:hypothetical protein